jgi:hypothetical protein
MFRLFVALASWFFTCLGMTLLGVSILVVPKEAFADSGCYIQCYENTPACASCTTDPNSQQCMACKSTCCLTCQGGDPSALAICCQNACGSDEACLANCATNATLAQCPANCNNTCPNLPFNLCNLTPMTSCFQNSVGGCDLCGCIQNIAKQKCYCFQ